MKNVVLFDLDGTLALTGHRQHYLNKEKPDWTGFFAACVDDQPNLPVIAALHAHQAAGHDVWIVSGRSDEVFEQTNKWLLEHVVRETSIPLLMRKAGDFTADDVLKRGWLNDGPLVKADVLCAYDYRDKVVAMWREEGIPCFQVAPGDF